ncbi:MAG TPA: PAS domain S-box protein [Sediminispirochaeta sp.]|nr:PAS domain S-box protein [Sediminispirochaeta sp.]
MKLNKVLVVEDESIIGLDTAEILRKNGIRTIQVASGEEARDEVGADAAIDLVLLDIDLAAKMDGPSTAEEILKLKSLPIVFHTDHAEREYVQRVKKISSYGYVPKSAGEFVLIETINMAFELFQAHRRIEAHNQAMERANDELQQRIARAEIVNELNSKALSDLPQQELLRYVVEKLAKLRPNLRVAYSVVEENGILRVLEAVQPPEMPDLKGLETDLNAAPEYLEALRQAEALIVEDVAGDSRLAPLAAAMESGATRALLDVPLFHSDSLIGLLCFDSPRTCRWGESEVALLQEVAGFLSLIMQKRRSQQELRRFFDVVPDMVCVLDLEGSFLKVNQAWEQVLGYPMEYLRRRSVFDLIHPDDLKRTKREINTQLAGGETTGFVNRYRHKDGSFRWIEWRAGPMTDGRLYGAGRDITQQRASERSLRASERKYRELFKQIRDAIVLVDKERRILDCNPAFEEIFGYSRGEIIGETTRVLFESEEDYLHLGSEIAKRPGERSFLYSARYRRKNGEAFFGEKNLHFLYDESGEIIGFMGLIRDISARKRAEERVQGLLEEKEMILREVHHRIKNDMAMISALLSLQRELLEEEEAKAALEEARHRVDLMGEIYLELFTKEQFDSLNIRGYLEGIPRNIRESYGHYGRIQVATRVDDLDVSVRQAFPIGIIINELITNAFKYAFPDGRDGRIDVVLRTEDSDRILIEVKDDGPGLPAGVLSGEELGFGLKLVKNFAQQYGGELIVGNRDGADFKVFLKRSAEA